MQKRQKFDRHGLPDACSKRNRSGGNNRWVFVIRPLRGAPGSGRRCGRPPAERPAADRSGFSSPRKDKEIASRGKIAVHVFHSLDSAESRNGPRLPRRGGSPPSSGPSRRSVIEKIAPDDLFLSVENGDQQDRIEKGQVARNNDRRAQRPDVLSPIPEGKPGDQPLDEPEESR